MKARPVAQEFARGSDRDDIFAATPPLMASRFVVSDTASRGREGYTSRRLAIFDVKRAFLHGIMEEEIYIELPDEDVMKQGGLHRQAEEGHVWHEVCATDVAEGGEEDDAGHGVHCVHHHSVPLLPREP